MPDLANIKDLAWYAFAMLTLISGILWHLCRQEADRDANFYDPLWFFDGKQFSEKGNVYRKRFILVTSAAFFSFAVWAMA